MSRLRSLASEGRWEESKVVAGEELLGSVSNEGRDEVGGEVEEACI